MAIVTRPLTVRAAGPDDVNDLIRLREQLFESGSDAHWAAGTDDWRREYRSRLDGEFSGADGSAHTLIAVVDGHAAGTLTAIVDSHLAGPSNPTGQSGWIQGVFVVPRARGLGLASSLTAAAETWLRAKGVRVVVLASTQAAESVYRGQGYVEDGETHFRKEL